MDADIGKVDVNGKKTGNALASMIKFGYKDYLMLFLFLNVCVNDEAILNRTADVIQLNVDKASTDNGAQYQHAVEDFKMNDACTYVHMSADVELDMLFMNLDMFNTYVDDGTTSVDEQISADATIKYNNVYGY